jgi:hypothetical protein
MALCHFALEDFVSTQNELEEALGYLRGKKTSMADYRQLAEVRKEQCLLQLLAVAQRTNHVFLLGTQ